jgi:hypothetical protein
MLKDPGKDGKHENNLSFKEQVLFVLPKMLVPVRAV